MEKYYQIQIKSKMEFRATVAALLSLGYSYDRVKDLDFIVNNYSRFPIIVVMPETTNMSGNYTPSSIHGSVITLSEFLGKLNPVVSVKLNDEYTAIVSKDEVVVGCQTFPISVVKQLSDAVNQIQSQ